MLTKQLPNSTILLPIHLFWMGWGCILFTVFSLPLRAGVQNKNSSPDSPITRQIVTAFESGYAKKNPPALTVHFNSGATQLEAKGETCSCSFCDGKELMLMAREFGTQLAFQHNRDRISTLSLQRLNPTVPLWLDGYELPPRQLVSLSPGEHVLQAQSSAATGHFHFSIQSTETLTPTPQNFDFPHMFPTLRRIGILAMGLGIAAASVGIAFISINDNCAVTRVDESGNCTHLHDTRPAGMALVGTAVGLWITGIAIFIHRRHKIHQERDQFAATPAQPAKGKQP